ncbi:MAG: glutamate 5-kinase [Geothermobacteraceae bacterium]
MRKQILANVRRLVVKIGSGVISSDSGLNQERVAAICDDVDALIRRGIEVILVSSGAVAAGKKDLGIDGRPPSIPLRQAAAAIGQSRLMRAYKEELLPRGHLVAQVLLTRDDLNNRRRYLNARNTLTTLLEHRVIPIINENDTVVVEELRFGDNDNLSAMTANLCEAGLLVIMSDIEGLYDRDPRLHPEARLLSEVDRITPEIEAMAGEAPGHLGTGGMVTKIRAARTAGLCGAATVILDGRKPGQLQRLLDGEPVGTLFHPASDRLAARKHWIAFTKKPQGDISLDAGAVRAVREMGRSLLPSGVTGAAGRFERGDAVRLLGPDGTEVARGIVNYAHDELRRIMGCKTADIETILGYRYGDEIVHRDNLTLAQDRCHEGEMKP